jgi:quercetin dioxygenase-like cupin family protein
MQAMAGIRIGLAAALIAAAMQPARTQDRSAGDQPAAKQRGHIAFSHALPALDGNRLKVTIVEVNYGPGESSSPHSHPCPVIGYVVAGAIRTQVKGGPETIVKAGESFYEAPNGIHMVSANASLTEPAKLLAYFVCDNDAPLSTPVPAGAAGGK